MNRRAFLGLLGGAITAVAAKPVLALVPAPAAKPSVQTLAWLDECNAAAFAFVSQVLPEHREHYRTKAFAALVKYRQASR